jgi:peptidyl-prolyl cis-trans isomerase B (cyclophilin B)
VTSLKDRQRAAARAKLEREMAIRQEQAAKRRTRRTWSAVSAIAVVLVIALVVIVVNASGGSKKKPAAAASVAPASATCVWTPNPNPSTSPAPTAPADTKNIIKTGTPPTTGILNKGTRTMTLNSNLGTITVTLNAAKAPCAAESLSYLASKKFYDKTTCDNLITQGPYVLMCGDPTNTGSGGPDYTFATENLPTDQQPNYQLGDVAMLNNGSGNGSQFMFIYKDTPVNTNPSTGAETPAIPSNFTIVGTVTGGMDVVQKIATAGAAAAGSNGATAPKEKVTFSTVTVSPSP